MQHYQTAYGVVNPIKPGGLLLFTTPKIISNYDIFIDEQHPYSTLELTPQMLLNYYYAFRFTRQKKKQNCIKIIQYLPLAKFGEEFREQTFLREMQKHQGILKPPAKDNKFMKEVIERGVLKVNDEGCIYVKSDESGYRKRLKKINATYAIPLLKGAKVQFFLRKYAQDESPRVKISKIQFNRKMKLAGILKIIDNRIFMQPRHPDYERFIPLQLPSTISNIINQYIVQQQILPYCIFKRYQFTEQTMIAINKILSNFIVKGKFVDWPLRFSHPVLELQEETLPMNGENVKQSIFYQLSIPFLDMDGQQRKQSFQIANSFRIDAHQNRQFVSENVFTFDSEGVSCFDDAFSLVKNGDGFQVSIHIADVAQFLKDHQYLRARAKARDQTIYIKNYYRSMFPQKLRDLMSLSEGRQKLAYTLRFVISGDGKINGESVEFKETMVNVQHNLNHQNIKLSQHIYNSFQELGALLKKSYIFQNYINVFDDGESQFITTQLIFLSSFLPAYIYQHNRKNISSLVQCFQDYIETICVKLQHFATEHRQQLIIRQCEVKLQNMMQNKEQSEKVGGCMKQNKLQLVNEIISCELNRINQQLNVASQSQSMFSDIESSDNTETQKEKEPIQHSGFKKDENSHSNWHHYEEQYKNLNSREGSAAECRRFLEKLFKAAYVDVDYKNPKSIQNGFKDCEKKFQNKIMQIYFRNKLIMSRQHFQTISNLQNCNKIKIYDDLTPTKFKTNSEYQKKVKTSSKRNVYESFTADFESDQEVKKQTMIGSQKKKRSNSAQDDQKERIMVKESQFQQKISVDNKHLLTAQTTMINYKTTEGDNKQFEGFEGYLQILLFVQQHNLLNQNQKNKNRVNQLIASFQTANIHKHTIEQSQIYKFINHQIQILHSPIKKEDQFYDKQMKQQELIKWNNPIRSMASLEMLTILKQHSWIFQGLPKPIDILKNYHKMSEIEKEIQEIRQYRKNKEGKELNGKLKEADREIKKLDFIFIIRQNPQKLYEFVTITSPSTKVQFVYHQVIEEVEVQNNQKEVDYYKVVKGKFKGIFDFPLKLKVELFDNSYQQPNQVPQTK